MCIRDRREAQRGPAGAARAGACRADRRQGRRGWLNPVAGCLLYTSDAADERSSVDLGGRRIIKTKQVASDARGRGYINARGHVRLYH